MNREDRLRELRLLWEELWDQGRIVSPEELCADCPELLPELREQIDSLREMKRWMLGDECFAGLPSTVMKVNGEAVRAGGGSSAVPETRNSLSPPDTKTGEDESSVVPATRISLPPTPIQPAEDDLPLSARARRDAFPVIRGYEILDEVGHGGAGVVYKARQTDLKRLVALKMILAQKARGDEKVRFQREAEAVARLQHPNIIQIYEVDEHQGQPFFSLEFADAGSLDRRIAGKPWPARESAELLVTLAQAMHAAHQKGIIHRDLKPGNVLLFRSEQVRPTPQATSASPATPGIAPIMESLIPKISDFGLAKQLDGDVRQTRHGEIMGTPSYMAPEQANGQLDAIGPWTDTYALGAILYELLTGRPPFVGDTLLETLDQVRVQEPVPPRRLQPHCPLDLETICLKALQKKRRARYHSAQYLADDLQRYVDGRPILARPVGRAERLLMWMRRSPMQAAAAAATAALVLMTIVALYIGMESARKETKLKLAELAEQQRESKEEGRKKDIEVELQTLHASARLHHQEKDWIKAEKDAGAAKALIASEPAFHNHSLRESLEQIWREARTENARAQTRLERQKLADLQGYCGDAFFFAVPFTGLELADNLARRRKAVQKGLALFLPPGDTSEPAIDPRFFDDGEVRAIKKMCAELLWLEADALAQVRSGEKEEEVKERMPQALKLLDRIDTLLGQEVHAVLMLRAICLERKGSKSDRREADRLRQTASKQTHRLALEFFEALDHYRRNEFGAAIPMLTAILNKQSSHYGAEYLRAVCQLREGRFQEATEGLKRCLTQRPEFSWPKLLLGFAEMQLENWDDARQKFNQVVDDPPDEMARYIARVNRGVLAVRLRSWDEAEVDFKQAIKDRADLSAAYVNLAVLYRQRAQLHLPSLGAVAGAGSSSAALAIWQRDCWQSAVTALDRAEANGNKVAALYHERAWLHQQLRNGGKAQEDLARAIKLSEGATPRLAHDLFELARLRFEGKEYGEAKRVLVGLLERVDPGHADAWRLKAQVLLAQNRSQDLSIACVTTLLQSQPIVAATCSSYYLIDQEGDLSQVDLAAIALDKYLLLARHTPENKRELSESYLVRGQLYERKGDWRGAADCYTRGLKVERDAALVFRLGRAYLRLEAPALAAADFTEVLRMQPNDRDALLGRAEARLRLDDLKKALEDVESSLRVGSPAAQPLLAAARVYVHASVRLAVKTPNDPRNSEVERMRERGLKLLCQALAQMELPEERRQFWRDHVDSDPAMRLLLQEPAVRRLL